MPPLSNAERQRQYRQRHLKDVDAGHERLNVILSLPAKAALERLASCHAITQRAALERALFEALERALRGHGDESSRDHDEENPSGALCRHQDDSPLPSNDTQEPLQGHKTNPPRGYPTDIKRLAVKLADEGQSTPEIRAAILAAHGKAPDISNLARLVRQWRAALAREADHD